MICQENMVYVSFSMYFLSELHSCDLSHQLLATGSQLFIFQERCHFPPFIYLPYITVGTGVFIFSSLPSPSVIYRPAPSARSWNDGLCESGRRISRGSAQIKGLPNWHLIQPNVRVLWVELHLCALEQVFLGNAQRECNSSKQKHAPVPCAENRSQFLPWKPFLLKTPSWNNCTLIEDWQLSFFINFAFFWQ